MIYCLAVRSIDQCSIVCNGDYELMNKTLSMLKSRYKSDIMLCEFDENDFDEFKHNPVLMNEKLKEMFNSQTKEDDRLGVELNSDDSMQNQSEDANLYSMYDYDAVDLYN